MNRTALLLLLVLSVAGCAERPVAAEPPAPAFTHPNLFLNAEELTGARGTDAARQVIIQADRVLVITPDPVAGVFHDAGPYALGRDGIVDPSADRSHTRKLERDAVAARNLGLAYGLSGDERYATAAVRVLDAWAGSMSPAIETQQAEFEFSYALSRLWFAADLVFTSPSWVIERRSSFQAWARALATNLRASPHRGNNHGDWRVVGLAGAAQVTEDPELMAYAFDLWRENLATQMQHDGSLPQELKRTRSLHYTLFALHAMTLGAEIARHQGIDLYGYVSPEGRSLLTGLGVAARYAGDPQSWPTPDIVPLTREDTAFLRLAALRYRDNTLHGATSAPEYVTGLQY
jgi:hypothetical protein